MRRIYEVDVFFSASGDAAYYCNADIIHVTILISVEAKDCYWEMEERLVKGCIHMCIRASVHVLYRFSTVLVMCVR